jgi:hypothetical protein
MSNNGLKPSYWGPTAWHFLHSVVMGYPEVNEDQLVADKYKVFFESLEFVLPCDWCKIHFKENLKTLPIDNYLDSRRNLALWLYKFHNLVNDATHVPVEDRPTFESIYDKYDSYRVPCDEDAKVCGTTGDKNKIHIIENNGLNFNWVGVLAVISLLTVVGLCVFNSPKNKKRKNKM